uniref:Uncharacterized protein n=1 Tax=Guillardia theta TaxID=55529 RepID=A0A7S4KN60_GUITH
MGDGERFDLAQIELCDGEGVDLPALEVHFSIVPQLCPPAVRLCAMKLDENRCCGLGSCLVTSPCSNGILHPSTRPSLTLTCHNQTRSKCLPILIQTHQVTALLMAKNVSCSYDCSRPAPALRLLLLLCRNIMHDNSFAILLQDCSTSFNPSLIPHHRALSINNLRRHLLISSTESALMFLASALVDI